MPARCAPAGACSVRRPCCGVVEVRHTRPKMERAERKAETRAGANAKRRRRDEGGMRAYARAQQPSLSAADGSIHAGSGLGSSIEKGAERIGLTQLDDLRGLALEHVETLANVVQLHGTNRLR